MTIHQDTASYLVCMSKLITFKLLITLTFTLIKHSARERKYSLMGACG